METRVVRDKVEIAANGMVQVRWKKQVVNGDTVVSESYHRTSFAPDADVEAQLAIVDAHLVSLGYTATPGADKEIIAAHATIARTPEIVAAFMAEKAERNRVTFKDRKVNDAGDITG